MQLFASRSIVIASAELVSEYSAMPPKKAPPPPPPSKWGAAGAPPPKAKAKAATGGSSIDEMNARLGKLMGKMDAEATMEMEDVDTTGIDESAKEATFKCLRCEQDVRVSLAESHMNSHSSEILPWLFLGAYRNADNEIELTKRTQITHVLNLAHECNMRETCREEWLKFNTERGLPCEYRKISWTDTADQDILQLLNEAMSFIDESHKANPDHHVLVHCVQGISRSTSVVLAYLMRHERMSLRDAFTRVKSVRTIVAPREEFLEQLGRFECSEFDREQPTLLAADVYSGKVKLNVD